MQINPKDQNCWNIKKNDGYAIFNVYAEARAAGDVEDSMLRYPETTSKEFLYLVRITCANTKVRSVEHALAYITDCNLATVCHMAYTKSRPKGEYKRQISIAQSAVDWMREFGVDMSHTRAEEVVTNHNGNVAEWAKSFEERLVK